MLKVMFAVSVNYSDVGMAIIRWLVSGFLALAISSCGGGGTDAVPEAVTDAGIVTVADPGSNLDDLWMRKGVFMEIYVRGYKDSDGDGTGDLAGVTEKLDYLQDLGVSGIWLMPITQSYDHDHGYGTVNYREIEPDYGTQDDLSNLLTQAHARGIGVIIDYVMNHSSSFHPLFQNSRDSKSNPYRDWYIWSRSQPTGWNTWGKDPWHNGGSGYYYGVFTDVMPDFNWNNSAVADFHADNLRYWLNLGVDGFRFDAVGVLVENGASKWESQPENLPHLVNIQHVLADYQKKFMVCESPGDPNGYSSVNACGSAFAFGLQYAIIDSAKNGVVSSSLENYITSKRIANQSPILANHDAFAGDRLYNQFSGDEAKYKLAAATLLMLPGTPFLYYGEEIGMAHATNVSDSDPDHRLRGPMSWTANTRNAGFSTRGSIFRHVADNVTTHNVAAETADSGSILAWYKSLIALRNSQTALSLGTFDALDSGNASVFAFLRAYDDSRELVVINYSASTQNVALNTGLLSATLTQQFPDAGSTSQTDSTGALSLSLAAQSILVMNTAVALNEPYSTAVYIRGSMNAWLASDAYKLSYQGDRRYVATLNLVAATEYSFKLADAAWGALNFGAAKGYSITLDEWARLEYAPDSGDDILLTPATTATYRVELDATEPMRPLLRVTVAE